MYDAEAGQRRRARSATAYPDARWSREAATPTSCAGNSGDVAAIKMTLEIMPQRIVGDQEAQDGDRAPRQAKTARARQGPGEEDRGERQAHYREPIGLVPCKPGPTRRRRLKQVIKRLIRHRVEYGHRRQGEPGKDAPGKQKHPAFEVYRAVAIRIHVHFRSNARSSKTVERAEPTISTRIVDKARRGHRRRYRGRARGLAPPRRLRAGALAGKCRSRD